MTSDEQTILSRLIGRRAFMGATAGATLAALAGREPRLVHAQATRPDATADAVIVLWMAGGMAQTETWDPKRYTPFEPGVRTERVLSTFPAIDTAVDHIKISQGLERVARVMDRGAIIRTFQAPDLGYILHSRHQYHWHTGYVPPQTVAMPHIGRGRLENARAKESDGARVHLHRTESGDRWRERIGQGLPHRRVPRLGTWTIPDHEPAGCRRRGSPPGRARRESRFLSRRQLYEKLLAQEPVYQYAGDFQRESLIRSLESADRLLSSPSAKAFDLSLEPRPAYDTYNTGRFGQGCLLAAPSR